MSTPTATSTSSIFKMFYTHKRTKELLELKGIAVSKVEKVSIVKPNGNFYNCVHVVYIVLNGGRCSTFINCKEYLKIAIQNRKLKAKEYKVFQQRNDSSFRVSKLQLSLFDTDKSYTVTASTIDVTCNCDDFVNQGNYLQEDSYLWEKVLKQIKVCKHCFAALNHLGFSSLNDYVKAWKPGGKLNNLLVTINRTTRKTA